MVESLIFADMSLLEDIDFIYLTTAGSMSKFTAAYLIELAEVSSKTLSISLNAQQFLYSLYCFSIRVPALG